MSRMAEEQYKLGSENGIDKTIILNHKIRSTSHRKWFPAFYFAHPINSFINVSALCPPCAGHFNLNGVFAERNRIQN